MALTINSLGIVSALVSFPLTGAWHIDVQATPTQGSEGEALTGSVTLDLNGLALTGTVLRSLAVDRLVSSRIVGGNGGLSNTIAARYYKGSPRVRRIVDDILRDCGETLSVASDAGVLDAQLNTWQRATEPAGEALSRILEAHGGSWRVQPNGQVLVVGAESWPTVEPPHTLVPGSDGINGGWRVAWPGDVPSSVLPGITFRGEKIRYVEHEVSASGIRTVLRFNEPRGFLERMRALVSSGDWYTKLRPAVVETQNADGSVDVVVDNSFGETQVPLRSGVPGLRVLVSQGQQVLLGYENADPRKPFAALWGQTGDAKFGTLAFSKASVSGVTVLTGTPSGTGPLFFDASDAGETAAQALSGTHDLVNVTTGTVRVS